MRRLGIRLGLFFLFALGLLLSGQAEIAIPDGYPPSRYQVIWQRSPFTLSSANDSSPAPQKLALTGILQIGNKTYASVIDKDSKHRFMVSQDEPVERISLVEIKNADDPAKVIATFKRDGELIQLRYDSDYLKHQAVPPASEAAAKAKTTESEAPNLTADSPSRGSHPPLVVRPAIRRSIPITPPATKP